MAGKGPAPTGKAIRRNKQPASTLIKSSGKRKGFQLPEGMLFDKDGEEEEWHPATEAWWEAWRLSPQAAQMLSEPDWFFLLDTALIHHNMWKNGRWEFASEVRLRVGQFGATPESRMRLRQEIEVPEKTPVGGKRGNNVASLDARRARMASGE